jgi:hypothetical protein
MTIDGTTLGVADLPDWDAPPSGRWQRSELAASVRDQAASRRSVLKFVVGGALGLGVWSLEMVPLKASATNPNPVLSVWGDCHGYINPTTVCVPSSAYYSSSVCSGSWHRNDAASGTGYSYNYTFNNTSCSTRNAWKWFGASGSGHSTLRRKCSDGHTEYADVGGTRISSFSICRTAI